MISFHAERVWIFVSDGAIKFNEVSRQQILNENTAQERLSRAVYIYLRVCTFTDHH